MNQELLMNPNCLVAALEKPAAEFTKADIISFNTSVNFYRKIKS